MASLQKHFSAALCVFFVVSSVNSISSSGISENRNPVAKDVLLKMMMLKSAYQVHPVSKQRRRRSKYRPKDWKEHYLFPLYPIDYPVCKDAERESKLKLCESWEKAGLCPRHKWVLSQYCKKTCKFCKAASPPACHLTRFGCCWDNTIARGPKYGQGCPRCFDAYPFTCSQFKFLCNWKSRNGRFIRYHCFRSCGRCDFYNSRRHKKF